MVTNRVLEDALEKNRKLIRGAVAVFFGKFHHGVLDDVERRFLVANSEHRLFEGASFRGGKKVRQFALAGQNRDPWGGRWDYLWNTGDEQLQS